MAKDVLASAPTIRRSQDSNTVRRFDTLKHFGATLVLRGDNIQTIRTAISNTDLPNDVKAHISSLLGDGLRDVRYEPVRFEYNANEHGNGGLGYKCNLYFQATADSCNCIMIVAGKEFNVSGRTEIRKEVEKKWVGEKEVEGWFRNTKVDVYDEIITEKEVVIPQGITEQEFK
eukprot:CAMPEP_0202715090 /NCGR_PEP_ID=MMETSP1385-20130828/84929_1 /ASSEMBLY_ACC=CAM_ASM_000861 /TAXON_ID=933848 /ORGANISM="Elphidium margaritaceum" /LENGTH=172 /DNA_ID=CAMNT_0049376193 /DNA_START=143 /DNA_END=658 /DNA_ORIENTATION=+